jgi:hypothetical protein
MNTIVLTFCVFFLIGGLLAIIPDGEDEPDGEHWGDEYDYYEDEDESEYCEE